MKKQNVLASLERPGSLLWLMVAALLPDLAVRAEVRQSAANVVLELAFTSRNTHADPFNDVTLDVVFADPKGHELRVPGFWAGKNIWKVRYASPVTGAHRWRSECNDAKDAGLHGVEGSVEISSYVGGNPLFRHGPVRVAADRRHFEHADGTPFFWLGDTWWMGLCHRLHWPEEFQQLTADRKEKGFTVVQIVAGLYPDMHPFDPRGANEAGFPWEKDYTRIRPEYFDAADERLQHLVEQGLTPCIVGAWGYFMPWMGAEKLKAHWRYLIARYGAMPVIWCAAGEANLPWYLAKGFPYDDREQVHGWTDVMRSIRATDPFRRPLTIHPTGIGRLSARNATDDVSLLDFDMLQTPHGQREAVEPTVRTMHECYADQPTMPVINGEAAYEMLSDSLPTAWTRAMFWLCMVNGAKGHTYGANGIWQCNRKGLPHGPSPTAGSPPNGYGVISWDEAMTLPGSTQLALGKRFFESLPWTELVPMPGSVAWAESDGAGPLGDWIWYPEGDPKRDAPVAARYFRRAFDVPDAVGLRRAVLRIAADDKFTVWLNGTELGSGGSWQAPAEYDVAPALRSGRNVLAVCAENLPAPVPQNPAGLTAAVTLVRADGGKTGVATDADWRTANTEQKGWREGSFDDSAWPAAQITAKFGGGPWGNIGQPKASVDPQACGVGEKLRVIYSLDPRPVIVRRLTPGTKYAVGYFDPVKGDRISAPATTASAGGELSCDSPKFDHDWVLLLTAQP